LKRKSFSHSFALREGARRRKNVGCGSRHKRKLNKNGICAGASIRVIAIYISRQFKIGKFYSQNRALHPNVDSSRDGKVVAIDILLDLVNQLVPERDKTFNCKNKIFTLTLNAGQQFLSLYIMLRISRLLMTRM